MTDKLKKEFRYLKYAAIAFTIAFSGYIYFYHVDGYLINKPYTFNVDPMNLELVQDSYFIGDTPESKISFCKNRKSKTTVQYTLADHQIVNYKKRATGRNRYDLDGDSYISKSEMDLNKDGNISEKEREEVITIKPAETPVGCYGINEPVIFQIYQYLYSLD